MVGLNDVILEEWNEVVKLSCGCIKERDDEMVNNFVYYNEGEIEIIDYIVDVLGEWDSIYYCYGNIIKYLSICLWVKGKLL